MSRRQASDALTNRLMSASIADRVGKAILRTTGARRCLSDRFQRGPHRLGCRLALWTQPMTLGQPLRSVVAKSGAAVGFLPNKYL
jgi:hypothetical protein